MGRESTFADYAGKELLLNFPKGLPPFPLGFGALLFILIKLIELKRFPIHYLQDLRSSELQ